MTNLTKYKMEMVVNCNIREQTANVYTRDKSVMQKLNRLVSDYSDTYKLRKQTDVDKSSLMKGMVKRLLFINLITCALPVNDKK